MTVSEKADQSGLVSIIDTVLTHAGFDRLASQLTNRSDWLSNVYEDSLCFVAVSLFSDVDALIRDWQSAQEELTSLLQRYPAHIGAKAWDGYLVLVTPDRLSSLTVAEITAIRSNTKRLRKLVLCDEDTIDSDRKSDLIARIARGLSPVLPLTLPTKRHYVNPLGSLADRLKVAGLTSGQIASVVDAYNSGMPIMSALHEVVEIRREGNR